MPLLVPRVEHRGTLSGLGRPLAPEHGATSTRSASRSADVATSRSRLNLALGAHQAEPAAPQGFNLEWTLVADCGISRPASRPPAKGVAVIYQIENLLVVDLPEGFVFGTGAFDAQETSPPGGPPPPGSKSDIPDDWTDPPYADEIRMLLELARSRATSWGEVSELEEEFRGYVDLALGVLYGPVDPAAVEPRSLDDIADLEQRLEQALDDSRRKRETLSAS